MTPADKKKFKNIIKKILNELDMTKNSVGHLQDFLYDIELYTKLTTKNMLFFDTLENESVEAYNLLSKLIRTFEQL